MRRAGCRSVRVTRGTTASIYPADTIPASQPACVLVKDQASMNCGRSAGIMEYPSRLRISAPHIAATIVGEGLAGVAGGGLEPVEHLRSRVDLVVVLAIGERRQLGEVWGEPRRCLGQVHKAVLDHCSLRVHPHDFVALRP